MSKTVKKWSLICLLVGVIGVGALIWPAAKWTHQNVTTLAKRHDSRMSPVIFIPGSSATQNRFDQLVTKLNTKRGNRHSLLKLTVHTDNKISYSGSIRSGDNEPSSSWGLKIIKMVTAILRNRRSGFQSPLTHSPNDISLIILKRLAIPTVG